MVWQMTQCSSTFGDLVLTARLYTFDLQEVLLHDFLFLGALQIAPQKLQVYSIINQVLGHLHLLDQASRKHRCF